LCWTQENDFDLDGMGTVPYPVASRADATKLHRMRYVIKVKVTLVQALRLCTGRTAHRESRGIALLFHDQR
jgi:hypothetical protein